jgi:hypothetical protein
VVRFPAASAAMLVSVAFTLFLFMSVVRALAESLIVTLVVPLASVTPSSLRVLVP